MADLSELGLNRFLCRDNSNINSASVLSSAFENTATSQGTASGGNGGGSSQGNEQIPAKDVVPGSIIVASLIQSSPRPQRVQITPDTDSLSAYDTLGNEVLRIDANGILALNGSFQNEIVYKAYVQNVSFSGFVNFDGTPYILPGTWSSSQLGTGDYEVTHNLGSDKIVVVVTPFDGWYRGRVTDVTTTTFRVRFQESTYAAGLYTGETLVDTGFNFIATIPPSEI